MLRKKKKKWHAEVAKIKVRMNLLTHKVVKKETFVLVLPWRLTLQKFQLQFVSA